MGADIGGTFTDISAVNTVRGEVVLAKVPTVPSALEDGLEAGLQLLRASGVPHVGELRHGTTVVTNAVLEQRYARTALLCTSGFRDVLETRRLWRQHLFGHDWERPPALIPRELRIGVTERIGPSGEVLVPLDVEELRLIARELANASIESVAVAFLFSFLNPAHEATAARILAEELPGVPVSLSSELVPEIHEYERTSTTVVNALVRPLVQGYFIRVEAALSGQGVEGPLRMVRSDGMLMAPKVAAREPVRLVMSGPAAGVGGARRLGKRLGWDNIVTLDMGGTSTDVSLIWAGNELQAAESDLAWNIPVRSTQVDIASIGAGGGSIVTMSEAGELRIGPRSAGALPGPVCYARGGTEPTLTDALAILGVLPPSLLGGEFMLDLTAAQAALEDRFSKHFGSAQTAADAISFVALHRMVVLIREVTTNRGYDPRTCVLFCFGGMGGAFAAELAQELRMAAAYVPPAASVFSALGASLSRVGYEASVSIFGPLEDLEVATFQSALDRAQAMAEAALAEDSLETAETRIEVDLKYRGQAGALPVALPRSGNLTERLDVAVATFHEDHARRFGMVRAGEAVDLVLVRSIAMGPDSDEWPLRRINTGEQTGSGSTPTTRTWHRRGERLDAVPVIRLDNQGPGRVGLDGPCLIENAYTTIAVPPETSASVDSLGGVTIEVR